MCTMIEMGLHEEQIQVDVAIGYVNFDEQDIVFASLIFQERKT